MSSVSAESLFRRVLELPAEERAAFLAGACGTNLALRRQVEALLTAHDRTSSGSVDDDAATLLGGNARSAAAERPVDESPGALIGRFRLMEKLGEGGFGAVWAAEQREPVKRRVALKIIKLGMDTRQVVARFEAERQALAMMDHPNIAKVLDAGATESGRPYFVMELVRGIPLTKFCDQEKLGTKARVELFIQVCHAVQHAHQKGIIHRDLKPSNILVALHDGVPVPKVIDFGIAKATHQDLTEKTIYTQVQQMIGTPAYMSPEQAEMSGLDIDTRSDIYSLGVVLYELLTGTTPFEAKQLMSMGLDAMRKMIREQEPPRPSTRLTQTFRVEGRPGVLPGHAESGSPDVHRRELIHRLRGDLDWIVMKCLEKDRVRRYDTANGLAADLLRHLNNEPVVARPPSTAYRMQKAIRRNKLLFGAAAAVSFALSLGLTVSVMLAVRATRAERGLQVLFESEQKAREAATAAQTAALAERDASRRHLYAANINLAHQAWLESNLGKARRLLATTTPGAGEEDLRQWEWRYLWSLVRGDDAAELARFDGGIFHVSFAGRDRQLIAGLTGAGSEERGTLLFDLAEGRARNRRLLNSESFSAASVLESSGSLLVFRRENNLAARASLLSLESLEEQSHATLVGAVKACAVSLDESMAAAYSASGGVVVWDTKQLKLLATVKAAPGGSPHFGRLAFLSDGEQLAIGQVGGRVLTVRARTGETTRDFPAHTNSVSAIAAAPHQRIFATGAGFSETPAKIWDAETGGLLKELAGHRAWITGLAFSPDGAMLASASADQTIRLWETATWKELATLRGHEDEVYCLAFSSDGRQLASGAKDGSLRLWKVPPQTRSASLSVLPGTVGHFVISPDSRRIVTLAADYVVWDLHTGEKLETLIALRGFRAGYDFTPDSRQLLVGGRQGKVRVWDFARNALTEFDAGGGEDVVGVQFLSGTNHFVTVHGAQNGSIKVWTHQERKLLREFKPEGLPATADAFGANGAVVTGHANGSVSFWDARTGLILTNFPAHRRMVVGLAFAPGGTVLASGGEEGLAKLWDTATLREIAALKGHLKSIHSLAIAPSGRRLATGGSGAEAVKFWDLSTFQELITLSGRPSMLRLLAFSSDGNVLAGLTTDGQLHLWRAPSWQEIAESEANPQSPPPRP